MILQYPRDHGKVYRWARTYARIFKYRGQLAAGSFANSIIPEQFHKGLTKVAQEEFELIKDK